MFLSRKIPCPMFEDRASSTTTSESIREIIFLPHTLEGHIQCILVRFQHIRFGKFYENELTMMARTNEKGIVQGEEAGHELKWSC